MSMSLVGDVWCKIVDWDLPPVFPSLVNSTVPERPKSSVGTRVPNGQ